MAYIESAMQPGAGCRSTSSANCTRPGGAGAVLAGVLGWLVIWLNTNQSATGLALSLLGAGLSAFVGVPYTQRGAAGAQPLPFRC